MRPQSRPASDFDDGVRAREVTRRMTVHGIERARIVDALDRAEQWLSRTEITSILMYADRMFLRAAVDGGAQGRADAARWIARADELLLAIDEDLRDDVDDTTSVLVIRWAFETLGERALVERLDTMLARYMHQLPSLAENWPEFERSTYFYWAERAGLTERRAPGSPPVELTRRVYHDLHLLMFATDYGARPLDLDAVVDVALVEALGYPERLANVRIRGENADLLAEALLVELALVPRRGLRVGTLLATLLDAVEQDGSLAPSWTAPLEARQHTTCVSVGVLLRALAEQP